MQPRRLPRAQTSLGFVRLWPPTLPLTGNLPPPILSRARDAFREPWPLRRASRADAMRAPPGQQRIHNLSTYVLDLFTFVSYRFVDVGSDWR